jgi:hypothetical protein
MAQVRKYAETNKVLSNNKVDPVLFKCEPRHEDVLGSGGISPRIL